MKDGDRLIRKKLISLISKFSYDIVNINVDSIIKLCKLYFENLVDVIGSQSSALLFINEQRSIYYNNKIIKECLLNTEIVEEVSNKISSSEPVYLESSQHFFSDLFYQKFNIKRNGECFFLLIPVFIEGGLEAIFIFTFNEKFIFDNEINDLLKAFSSTFGSGIIRKKNKTNYRLLHKKLKEEKEMILENVDLPIFYLLDPRTYGYVNHGLAKIIDQDPEDIINRDIYNIYSKEKADLFYKYNKLAFESKCEVSNIITRENIDGKEYTFTCTLIPKIDERNEVEYVIGISFDLTEFEKIKNQLKNNNHTLTFLIKEIIKRNQELKRSQEIFRINFEGASIGMKIEDVKGNFLKVNDALINMLGYTREEFMKTDIFYYTHPDDLKKSKELYDSLLRGENDSYTFTKRYIHKNGDIVWANLNIVMVRDENNEPLYILGHVEDITERKNREKVIKKQREEIEYKKLQSQFFANLSHELRTPLNLIFSALQILRKRMEKESREKDVKYIQIMRQNSMRLIRLVNNIIDLTKIGMNSFNLNRDYYDIILIIEQIIDSTEDYILNNGKIVRFISDIDKKVVYCDPFSIERILLNLISNAVKFTEKGDVITIKLEDKKEHLLISINDTGIGIENDKLDIIFEMFRQVDKSFTRKVEGSGIGLSIVKSLVELHQGEIYVESQVGVGTTFYIKIPYVNKENDKEENQGYLPDNLIDKIDVELSDIYTI
ncbi:MAG: PAS domain-containing sensor histidine kinase [bacterium]